MLRFSCTSRNGYGLLPDDRLNQKGQHREDIPGRGRTKFACLETDHQRDAIKSANKPRKRADDWVNAT